MPISYTSATGERIIHYMGYGLDSIDAFEQYILPTLDPKPTSYSYIDLELARHLEAPTLTQSKNDKVATINNDVSNTILEGFDYTIQGQTLRFSYDVYDQQNFADTANVATLIKMGVPLPMSTITWNGWKTTIAGKQLVRLELTPDEFLELYTAGALAFKLACMEYGSHRKEAVNSAKTVDELEGI